MTQVSRFDRLTDPVGVIRAYKLAKKHVDYQLVLASGRAADDPKGAVVLQEVKEAAGSDADIIVRDLPPWCALEINALQQASTLVIQKSLKGRIRSDSHRSTVERKTHNCRSRRRHS